jgi:Fic family protein
LEFFLEGVKETSGQAAATARVLGISAPTVAKSFVHLAKLGMLREITGRQRRLEILNQQGM